MEKQKNGIALDLSELAKNFNLEVATQCSTLDNWLNASYELKSNELELLKSIFEKVQVDGNYWNESGGAWPTVAEWKS